MPRSLPERCVAGGLEMLLDLTAGATRVRIDVQFYGALGQSRPIGIAFHAGRHDLGEAKTTRALGSVDGQIGHGRGNLCVRFRQHT